MPSEAKYILVKRATRLDELIARFNTHNQAAFYVERLGADFSDYVQEHNIYEQAIATAERILGELGKVQTLDWKYLPNYIFGPEDTVVAVGRDGLVANVLKYLNGQPLIGVNPDPQRWDGVLLPFTVDTLTPVARRAAGRECAHKEVCMALVQLNDGQSLLAVNDFFIGQKTHISARYSLTLGGSTERQSSSGIIVSTGLGSTGWLKSVVTGATQISQNLSEVTGQTKASLKKKTDKHSSPKVAPQKSPKSPAPPLSAGWAQEAARLEWDAQQLYFSVREPYPSQWTQANLVFGKITSDQPLIVQSHMGEGGVIFSDGVESDFLSFNSGIQATIEPAAKKGILVIP